MDNDDTISSLNRLIETSKDGEYGFAMSAEHARDTELKQTLQRRAGECREGALELQRLVTELGGKAEDSGTAGGAVHRGWVAVKSKLASYTDKAILEECESAEDTAVARYRKALQQDLPVSVRSVVERQMIGVQRNHDQIRSLRDQARALAE